MNRYLIEVCEAHKNSVCLHLSGGADSLLLLEAMIELNVNFGVLHLDDGFSRRQKKTIWSIIEKHRELQIFSYPARTHLLIGKHRKLALVSYYAVNNKMSFPLLRDIIPGEKCAFEMNLETAGVAFPPIEFDAHIRGSRFDDTHWSVKRVLTKAKIQCAGKMFYAPLAQWTREEVLAGLKEFGIDWVEPTDDADTGNLSCCSVCLQPNKKGSVFCPKAQKMIPIVKWKPAENLKIFRTGKMSSKNHQQL